MKTSELIGASLNWAVMTCEGYIQPHPIDWILQGFFTPSPDWAQGGLIIEREGLTLTHQDIWVAQTDDDLFAYGPTPLIAAMRCYCCAKLGDEIEIPEELCQQQSS